MSNDTVRGLQGPAGGWAGWKTVTGVREVRGRGRDVGKRASYLRLGSLGRLVRQGSRDTFVERCGTSFTERHSVGTGCMLRAGLEIFQDVGGGSSKSRHTRMLINIFVAVQAASGLLTRGVGRCPMVGVKRSVKGGGSIPTVRISKLVVCEDNGVDQMDQFVRVGAVKSSFVGGLGNVCSLACNDGFY